MLFYRKQIIEGKEVNDTVEFASTDEVKSIMKTLFKKRDDIATLEEVNYQNGSTAFRLKDKKDKIIFQLKTTNDVFPSSETHEQ
jgi:hypothetical protein